MELIKYNYNYIYEYLYNNYKKNKYEKRLNINLNLYHNTNNIIKKYFKKYNSINDKNIYDIHNIFINHIYKIICSFNDKKFLYLIKNHCFSPLLINNNINNWEFINAIEIKNRLYHLIDIFGLSFLRKIKIDIINVTIFDNYDYQKKIKYYKMCIKNINDHFEEYRTNYILYLDIIDNINKLKNTFNYHFNEIIEYSVKNTINDIISDIINKSNNYL